MADSWGLFDVHTRAWRVEAVVAAGIPERLLPLIVQHDHVVRVRSQVWWRLCVCVGGGVGVGGGRTVCFCRVVGVYMEGLL